MPKYCSAKAAELPDSRDANPSTAAVGVRWRSTSRTYLKHHSQSFFRLGLLVSDRARRSCLGLTRYRPVITLTGRAAGLGWVCRRRQTAEGPDQVTAPPGVVRLHGGPRQTTLGAGLSPSQLGVGVQRQQSVSAPRPLSVWDTEPVQAEMPRYGIDVAGILRSPSFCKMPRHFSKRLTNQALCKMSSLFAK